MKEEKSVVNFLLSYFFISLFINKILCLKALYNTGFEGLYFLYTTGIIADTGLEIEIRQKF